MVDAPQIHVAEDLVRETHFDKFLDGTVPERLAMQFWRIGWQIFGEVLLCHDFRVEIPALSLPLVGREAS